MYGNKRNSGHYEIRVVKGRERNRMWLASFKNSQYTMSQRRQIRQLNYGEISLDGNHRNLFTVYHYLCYKFEGEKQICEGEIRAQPFTLGSHCLFLTISPRWCERNQQASREDTYIQFQSVYINSENRITRLRVHN